MRSILILLFLSYACSDKLDLTYLPPPGSQYSGGRAGDIQTPLEFPKQTYSTTGRPPGPEFSLDVANPAEYEATIGINRIPPRTDNRPVIPGSNVQNTFGVPTTTVSYAFTQTTTHPPSELFETTINPITGLPTLNNFNTASQEPGFQENISTQYYPSTPSSTSGGNFYEGTQNLPGRQGIHQNGYEPSFSTTSALPPKFSGGAFPSSPSVQTYEDRTTPGQSVFQYNQQTNSDRDSPVSFGPSQYNLNNTLVGSLTSRPAFVSSTTTPHSLAPGVTYNDNININQGYSTTNPGKSQTGFENSYGPGTQIIPNQYQSVSGQKSLNVPSQNQFQQNFNQNRYSDQSQIPNQQYSGAYDNNQRPFGIPTQDSSKPRLTSTPGLRTTPSLVKQQPDFNRYDTKPSDPRYNGSNNFGNIPTINRLERPQAEADRNAVILNYENVLTPEGFAYTFDTSNGIHADESGTALDGVKAKGSFSYTGDDGNVYSIVYTADENGFQPHGDHLPTPPPIPEAIQRIIEKVKQEKEAGIFDDGTYDEGKYGFKKYQGDKGDYPQDYDAITRYGIDYQKKDQYNLPIRTQIGPKSPPGGSKTVYDKTVQPSSQIDYDHEISSNDEVRPSQYINIKPIDRVTGQDGKLKDIANKSLISRIPSRRPSVVIDKNQYKEDDNRRRPSAQYPERENERQYIGDTEFKAEATRKGTNIKGSSRRPVSKYDKDGTKIFQDNDDVRNESTKGFTKLPVEYEDKHKQGAFDSYLESKVSSDRPSRPSYVDSEEYDVASEDNRKELLGTKTSNRYPSDIEKGDDGVTSLSPSSLSGPRTNKPTNKLYKFDQTITKTRRPNRPGLRVNDNEQYSDYTDNTHEVEDDSQNNNNLGTTTYYGTYEDEDKITSDAPQIYSTKYAATQDDYQNPDTTDEYDHFIDENSKNQNIIRVSSKPVHNPRADIIENIYRNGNKTGYRYIPPRKKFDEINNLPGSVSTTRRPSQQKYYPEGSTGRPYVTPSGTQVTYNTPDDEYNERDVSIGKYPSQNLYQDRPNVNIDTRRRPGQTYSKDIVSTLQPSTTPSSPTYSSTYQTTRRPQYSQTPDFQNKFEATVKANQPSESSYYEKIGTRRPYDGVPSTTPKPSIRPAFYDSTQYVINPGQQNIYFSEGTRKPGVFSPSTIPSTQGPGTDGYSTDGKIATQYSNYRTMEPVNPTNGYRAEITASRLPTAGPTKGPTTFESVKYGSRLPSTTYRPNYTIVDSPTARPGIVVDRYGRPLPTLDSQEYNQQYPDKQTNVSVANKPGRPQYGPKGELIPTEYQTSTQRIIGEDFSGPKQQQKFDPKTGYYY